MIRTTEKTVIFRQPFFINKFDKPLPAGDYLVETDEELLEGLSFRAYRRILTVMQLPAGIGHRGKTHSLTVDPNELDAALKRDREIGEARDDREFVQVQALRFTKQAADRTAADEAVTAKIINNEPGTNHCEDGVADPQFNKTEDGNLLDRGLSRA